MFGQVARVRRLDGDRDRSVQRDVRALSRELSTASRVSAVRTGSPERRRSVDKAVADGLIGDVEQADVAPVGAAGQCFALSGD